MKKLIVPALFVLALVLASNASFAQCAMCKATVESNLQNGSSSIGKGLNTGILYLMVIPYILFVIVGYYWYRSSKKEKSVRDRVESVLKSKLSNA